MIVEHARSRPRLRARVASASTHTPPQLMVVLVLCVLVLLLLAPSLLGSKILSSGDYALFQGPFAGAKPASLTRPGNSELADPALVFQPDLVVIRRAIEAGASGLWNPYQQGGQPLLASQQTAPLFPLTWLVFLRSFWRSLAWIAALKLLLAAGGLYMLGRWTGLRRGPALLAAIAYAFCTYMNDLLQFPVSGVLAMTPWTMLAAARVARRGRLLDGVLLAFALGLEMLTGSPELIVIALGGVTAYALYELLRPVPAASSLKRRFALLAVGGVGGLALSAAALGPFIEFLGVANTTSRGNASGYPNSIAYAFFFPELWGRPDKAIGQFGPINYTERTAYLGALPLLLAVGGLFARRPRGPHLFWALFGVVAGLIAMDTFVHTFVVGLPGPDHVNMLRTLSLVELAGALLAGLGLQRWLEADGPGRRRMSLVMSLALLVPVAVLLRDTDPFSHFGGALGQLPSLSREAVAEKVFIKQVVAWRWIVFGGLGLLLLAVPTMFPRVDARVVVGLVVALVAVDLLTMDAGFNPQIPLADATPPTPPALAYVQANRGHQRVSGTLGATGVALQANLAERYALPDVGSYNFPKTSRWANLWSAYGQLTGDQNDWNPELPTSHEVLDAFAVKYVLPAPGTVVPPWLKPVYTQTPGEQPVLENATALPRAWVAYEWREAHGQLAAAAATARSTTAELLRAPILEGVPTGAPSAVAGAPTPAQFLRDEDEHVALAVDAARAGYLILEDSYYPGWEATVDGKPAKIVPANEAFRAVEVPAGRHRVDFRYHPASFWVGALISGAAALLGALCLALMVRSRWKRVALP